MVDHAGRGKSTILKFLTYYLYPDQPSLEKHLVPIYLSLRNYEGEIRELDKASELNEFMSKKVKEASFKIAYEAFRQYPQPILEWINIDYPSPLQGRFSAAAFMEIVNNPTQFLSDLTKENSSTIVDFIMGALSWYSRNIRTVALLLDDADNFSIDTQWSLLSYAEQKDERRI